MKLLIINNHDSFTFNLVDLIRKLNVPYDVLNVEDLKESTAEKYSHILISPGPDVPRVYPQLFSMLEKYYQQKSILGVCLGHQTLCEFFGGTLYNLQKVRHGQKRILKVRSNSPLFFSLPSEFNIGHFVMKAWSWLWSINLYQFMVFSFIQSLICQTSVSKFCVIG